MDMNTLKTGDKPKQKREIEQAYQSMTGKRDPFLSRGREYSEFTLPHILPMTSDSSGSSGSDNGYGWENIGAAATNHLSNKMANTLFPPHQDFFALEFSTDGEKALLDAGIEKSVLNQALTTATRKAKEVEKKMKGRIAMYQAMEHLIVVGNVLVIEQDKIMHAIPLDRYVVSRDRASNVKVLIIEETKSLDAFPSELRSTIKMLKATSTKQGDDITMYTRYKLDEDEYIIEQEVEGVMLDLPKHIPKDEINAFPLRWKFNYGEDYGRGLVENHAADFYVIRFLSEAITKGMALMADVKYLIKPGSMIDIERFIQSPTGEVLYGQKDDVTIIQLEKYADFTPISEVLSEYKRRIGSAFLMNSANRRDAERVTTVELRMDASELEGAFGGIYTQLDVELQTPYSKMLLREVNFDTSAVSGMMPSIKTGMDALGKLGDLEKLYQFSEIMQLPATWPELAQKAVVWTTYMSEAAVSLNMAAPWMKTPDQLAAEAKAEAEQAMTEEATKSVSNGLGKAVPEMLNQQQPQQ